MSKMSAEVCILSGQGLGRSSSLWKSQWFAVGWIDPDNKYCTKIDSSGSGNPTWKTKFVVLIDDNSSSISCNALHVEVYSRDPIFLREKLQGTAIVELKEFLGKNTNERLSSEGVGSFQLLKKNSEKPRGFVNVSFRISEHGDGGIATYSGSGDEEGFELAAAQENRMQKTSPEHGGEMQLQGVNHRSAAVPSPFHTATQPSPYEPHRYHPTTSSNSGAVKPSHHRQIPRRVPTPPPPPPPCHVGYLPTFLPSANQPGPSSYINLLQPASTSASSAPSRGAKAGPAFGMGVGAGALAAGAFIFGDDFMSGFDLPPGLPDGSLTISTDPLF
ncbi:hypothetical protein Syun_014061 [Stephania yunnanensis]|uniref:C2 domain-containing protein n=1 Tax=Stephania yunnanensis TaxID=152371 RepID=A0AAP0JJP5_9MAGN